MRVSRSGGWMSVINPPSNRERSRSSRVSISMGGLSELMTICLPLVCRALKVLKNSSWVDTLPEMNWISSTINTSTFRYLLRNWALVFSWMDWISS